MKKLFILLVLLLPLLVFADETETIGTEFLTEKIAKAIAQTPAHSQFPDAKACYLFKEKEYILEGDGKWSMDVHYLIKLYTYKGKKAYSNFKFQYDTTFQNYEILEARSINPDGEGGWEVSPIPNHSVNEITPPHLTGATQYARKKQLVLSVPAVTESSYIEIKVNFDSFDRPPTPWGGMFIIADEDPIIWSDMSVYSRDIELKYNSAHGAPEVEIFNDTLHWIIENYQGMTAEGDEPYPTEFLPTVTISSQSNWTAATGFFAKGFLPKAIVTEAITKKAEELTQGKVGEEQIWAIVQFVSDEMKKYHVNLSDVDYSPKSADEILQNGSGDSRELVVLLMALFKAKGIKANPILVPKPGITIREDIPTIDQFDMVALEVNTFGKKFFIDPMQEDCMQNFLGQLEGERGLLVKLGKYEFIDFPEPKAIDNKILLKYLCQVDDAGDLKGWVSVKGWGEFDCNIRSALKDKSPRKLEMIMEDIVSGIKSGTTLLKDSAGVLDDPTINSSFSFKFEAEDFASVQEDMMLFEFPGNPVTFASKGISATLKERKNSMFFDFPFTVEIDFTLTLPKGYEMVFLTPTGETTNSVGSVTHQSSKQGDKVSFNRILQVNDQLIEPSEYEMLREIIRSWRTPKNKLLLLEQEAGE